jgi:hypothetical protein
MALLLLHVLANEGGEPVPWVTLDFATKCSMPLPKTELLLLTRQATMLH